MPVAILKRHFLAGGLVLGACGGGGMSGVYEPPNGEGFFDRLTFHGGGTVDITFMGATKEATWKREGDRLTITNDGETQVFAIDDQGCADGGGLLGRYCKGESAR
jgi:hypothetical protein